MFKSLKMKRKIFCCTWNEKASAQETQAVPPGAWTWGPGQRAGRKRDCHASDGENRWDKGDRHEERVVAGRGPRRGLCLRNTKI